MREHDQEGYQTLGWIINKSEQGLYLVVADEDTQKKLLIFTEEEQSRFMIINGTQEHILFVICRSGQTENLKRRFLWLSIFILQYRMKMV